MKTNHNNKLIIIINYNHNNKLIGFAFTNEDALKCRTLATY